MSDDTPTQKFDAAGEDAPTELLAQQPVAGVPEELKKSKRLIIILASIGGALLLALIIIVILLLTRGGGQPSPTPTPTESSASPTPSPTPSVTPTPTPTATAPPSPTAEPVPPSTDAKINNFSGTDTIFCNTSAPVTPDYTLSFEWSTSNANTVYFGVAVDDASQGALFTNLPPNGNSADDFEYDVEFPCHSAEQKFTLTVIGDNGDKVSKTIYVTNEGDTQ